jgi:hypothetical protein
MSDPQLLRIPRTFHSVDEVLGAAKLMELPNILVLSELANGNLVLLDDGMTVAQANWLLDRAKVALLGSLELK